ncbi:hypothetical protein M0811_11399 [Anaeramoeba ignava]|uniref:Uncharacterized protein n=1 Tax=Anaeramoeba ignava TaxID=1746090 RepID=A0A9Q0LBM1_ANAIG|nr:hypothetical protein M0811_11399 [Anaeramoeba ignava]
MFIKDIACGKKPDVFLSQNGIFFCGNWGTKIFWGYFFISLFSKRRKLLISSFKKWIRSTVMLAEVCLFEHTKILCRANHGYQDDKQFNNFLVKERMVKFIHVENQNLMGSILTMQ